MPTAENTLVTIKWLRIQVTPKSEDGTQLVHVDVRINVDGELVRSFTEYTSDNEDDILLDLESALEGKRMEYVST